MSEVELIGTIYSYLIEEFGFGYCEKDLWMISEKLAKRIANKQPPLNDNQQIVLDWLKWDFNKNKVKAMECIYRVVYGENILDMVLLAYIALDNKHQVQVLEVFARWAQEQEGEDDQN